MQEPPNIRVGIIDHDQGFRTDLSALVKNSTSFRYNIDVITLSDSLPDLLSSTKDLEIQPEIIVINIAGQPSSVLKQIKRHYPDTQIIAIASGCENQRVRSALREGAFSFLMKRHCYQFLLSAIEITFDGGSFICPDACRSLVHESQELGSREDILTGRELQIVKSLASGMSYKMIADNLDISLNTVRVYIKRIYAKFKVNSRRELLLQLNHL